MSRIGQKLRKLTKVFSIIIGILIIAVIALSLFSGTIAKRYIEKHSKELIGRKVTVERIFINPLFGKVRTKNFKVFEKDDKSSFLTLKELDYGMNVFALINKKVKVKKVHFDSLRVNIIQGGKNFNFDDIINHFASSDEPKKSKKEGKEWIIDLNDIKIANSNFLYKDLEVGSKFGLNRVNIQIPRIYLAGKETDAGVNLNFDEGGSLSAKLSYNMDKSKYNLKLNLNDFSASHLLPYLQQYLNVSQTKGLIALDINIIGETEHIMNANIDGDVSINSSEVIDKAGNMIFAIERLEGKIAQLNFEERVADFESLKIIGAQTKYTLNRDSTTNFTGLLDIKDVQEGAESQLIEESDTDILEDIGLKDSVATQRPMDFKIGLLQIVNGTVTYTDHTLPQSFVYKLSEISTNCSNFALDKQNRISGNAVLGQSGKVRLDWVTDFKSMRNMDLVLNLNNIDIKDFTPYSYYYVGNNIESGKLQLISHNVVKENKLNGENKLEIFKPKVSKRINKEPIYKLPVRFGVYVLTDRKELMAASLPVSGDLDNPKFSYRKLIFKALANLLIKVTTAPFSAIGGLFSSDDGDIDAIQIDSRVPDFSPQEYAKLEELVKWLQEKPEIKVEFIQRVNMSNLISVNDSTASQTDSLSIFNEEKILALAKLRNENLNNYLLRMALPQERFQIAEIVADSLKSYKGKDKFSIVTSLEGDDEDFEDIAD